jgi:heterodisulfide reductase subunit A
MNTYVVVGAGITGCTAALELARQGNNVSVLESTGRLGGKILSYACKATDSCSRCGVCVAHARVSEALLHPNIEFLAGSSIDSVSFNEGQVIVAGHASNPAIAFSQCIDCGACVEKCPAHCITRYGRGGLIEYNVDYSTCLLHRGKKCSVCAAACPVEAIRLDGAASAIHITADGVLLATGHDTFNPVVKPRLGYGRVPGVITGFEAEEILSERLSLDNGGDGVTATRSAAEEPAVPADPGSSKHSVAFIQCVGSRDPRLGRNFCSAVCCAYALRMARVLMARAPGGDVTVYYIDIQNFDKVFTPLRAELEGKGVRFVRGIPSSVTRNSRGRLSLLIEDPRGGDSTAEHDTVVLSVGLGPTAESAKLAALFGLERDEFGFLSSARPNVLAAGTCREPQGIVDSMADARAAVWELEKGVRGPASFAGSGAAGGYAAADPRGTPP